MATTLADRSSLPRRLVTQRKKRRGIVLLMVVSLLALFLLMGVTFAILAIQYKTAADVQAGVERYGDDPMQDLEMGVGAVLYDTQGLGSLRGVSLLRDMYGNDYVHTNVNGAPSTDNRKTANNQFVVFPMNTTTITGTAANIPGFYNGRVLTFISGAAAGISTRVAGYEPVDPVTNQAELYVEPLVGPSGNRVMPANNDQFVINGAPFNGMGFGYDPATYGLDAVDSNSGTPRPVVLLPHFAGYPQQQVYSTSGTAMAPDVGGADEPYDAPGPQDPHLSIVSPGLIASRVPGQSNQFTAPLVPSYNPSALINYWLDSSRWPGGGSIQLSSNQQQKDLARQIIFRPMPWDHRNFTGGNPYLTAPTGTDAEYQTIIRRMAQSTATGNNGYYEAIWDVDNDGDGIRDSVWVDIGLPVMTSASGRRYKRLYAFLIKDLDGRINLNVHGNLSQWDQGTGAPKYIAQTSINYPFPVFGPGVTPAVGTFPTGKAGAMMPLGSLPLPRGMGFGPAEVDFSYVLQATSLTNQYGPILRTRYGNDGVPGTNGDDPLSTVKMSGVPANFIGDSWYASLPDVWGRNAVAVDFGGRPFFYRESINAVAPMGETIDDPYEMQWDPKNVVDSNSDGYPDDAPYTVADMERLSRPHDNDSQGFATQLPVGLFTGPGDPTNSNGAYQRLRESLTTMSSHVPVVPGIFRPSERVYHGNGSTIAANAAPSIINLYRLRFMQDAMGASIVSNPNQFRTQLSRIMPWEFWQGKPLDLNRYLNNGVDENRAGPFSANGEPAEAPNETAFGTNPTIPSGGALPGAFNGVAAFHTNNNDIDLDGVGGTTTDRLYARHLMARHLYCLIWAINGNGYNPPNVATPGNQAQTARMFAQWAVNIVDFRDVDGIMTGFEYDINPWNGWTVDGNLATTGDQERAVVWGCEAPELVLTEAFAMHDRRTKDTKYDVTRKERADKPNPDDDVDQFRVPQGSLFFELFCPRTHPFYNTSAGEAIYNPHQPFEMYDRTSGKLELGLQAPGGSPVWQVAIARLARNTQPGLPTSGQLQTPATWETTAYSDPVNNPNITTQASYPIQSDINNPNQTIQIERYMWFTTNDLPVGHAKRNTVFYNKLGYDTQLAPGQYMVVGPRAVTYMGSNKAGGGGNPNGFWNDNSPQSISLTPGPGVQVTDAATGNPTSKAVPDVQPVLPMVAMMRPPDAWGDKQADTRWWVGMNVTEPLPQGNYYAEYNTGETIAQRPIDAYDDPGTPLGTLPDQPEDNRVNSPVARENMIESNVYQNVSAVFLQRLADPTRAWDPLDNPYITVDFAPVDATVFSGEEDTNRTFKADPADPASADVPIDPLDPPPGGSRIPKFATGQRGVAAKGNMWFPIFSDSQVGTIPAPNTTRYMQRSLNHTLGYINQVVGTPRDAAASGGSFAYAGDPTNGDKPFPWITWNNRPYMNAAELLMVPTSAPNRLVLEISPDHPLVPNAGGNPYNATSGVQMRQPFAHLMNMFQSTTVDTASMNLCRLLDCVEVPSNFVGAERWYPNLGTIDPPPGSPNPSLSAPPYLYRPPFNKLSRFRDPGKININTIFDPAIWSAIVGYDATNANAFPGLRITTANDIFMSRQGYPAAVGMQDSAYPSLVSNPFRPADTADLMPPNLRNMPPVDVTLFRRHPSRNDEPLFMNQSSNIVNDTSRNAYFRYQALQKLPNIVGMQSNCYAVWATVGYFEVEDSPGGVVNSTYPDGFMLGQELDSDQGKSQRHRGFFLIDRSIPAGFIPGLKLNTDNCVLLRRQVD